MTLIGTTTNNGLEETAKLINGVSSNPFKYIAIGSGSNAENEEDSELQTEITTNGGQRTEATCSYEEGNKAKWEVLFNFTGEVTVREVGIFNASENGIIFARKVLPENIIVNNGDLMIVRATHKVERGVVE